MKFKIDKFRVDGKLKHSLSKFPTVIEPFFDSEETFRELMNKRQSIMANRQDLFYADGRNGLLMIFQGMDAAGKDGAVKHVMSGLNPQGVQVTSFGVPSKEELKHDFLWRSHQALAPRGKFTIFNRSYYEEVLTVQVHKDSLAAENLPVEIFKDSDIWATRFKDIRHHEEYLTNQGYKILKFFLHISKSEQKTRLLSRLDEPDKNWKLTMSDVKERGYWKKYQAAYEDAISATASSHAPWFIIPADDKKNARLIISRIIADELEAMKLSHPTSNPVKKLELKKIKKELAKS
jgi:PPK2 family polyphosphate:nucleotide phosphotransferase